MIILCDKHGRRVKEINKDIVIRLDSNSAIRECLVCEKIFLVIGAKGGRGKKGGKLHGKYMRYCDLCRTRGLKSLTKMELIDIIQKRGSSANKIKEGVEAEKERTEGEKKNE